MYALFKNIMSTSRSMIQNQNGGLVLGVIPRKTCALPPGLQGLKPRTSGLWDPGPARLPEAPTGSTALPWIRGSSEDGTEPTGSSLAGGRALPWPQGHPESSKGQTHGLGLPARVVTKLQQVPPLLKERKRWEGERREEGRDQRREKKKAETGKKKKERDREGSRERQGGQRPKWAEALIRKKNF